jgi:hypothetical protein
MPEILPSGARLGCSRGVRSLGGLGGSGRLRVRRTSEMAHGHTTLFKENFRLRVLEQELLWGDVDHVAFRWFV